MEGNVESEDRFVELFLVLQFYVVLGVGQAYASNANAITSRAACKPGNWNFQQCVSPASQIK